MSVEFVQLSRYFSHLILVPLKKDQLEKKLERTISTTLNAVHTWCLWWLLDGWMHGWSELGDGQV